MQKRKSITTKKGVIYTLSAMALIAGAGFLTPAVWADDAICTAANLDELETCLAGEVANISVTKTIVVEGESTDVTLVTNGKVINGIDGSDLFYVKNGAKLTLRGNGVINSGRYGANVDGSELVIDGPTIDATRPSSYGIYAKNNGKVTMEAGQVIAEYAAFAGNNTTGDMNFYINGGLLKSNSYPAIYMPGQVDLVMRGGTLDGGIVARMGQIVIDGGTINQQTTPVTGDGIAQNYSSMPSVANEAITLLAGTYKSENATYGNDMNVTINNGKINGDIVLYDLGNTAEGYTQNVNVKILGGILTDFKTKYTVEEIGFDLKKGYTAGLNNEAGRIKTEISGGAYAAEPNEEDIAKGYEAELNEETSNYEILPVEVNWENKETETAYDGEKAVTVKIDEGLTADRKASFKAEEKTDLGKFNLVSDGKLYKVIDIDMVDRNGNKLEVSDTQMTIRVDIDKEMYDELVKHQKVQMVYFDDEGKEVERIDATLKNEGDKYWIEFTTSHLSTYGVVGVGEAESTEETSTEEDETAATVGAPETGTMTTAGASALSATILTSVVVGILVSVTSFAVFIRRK